MKKTLYFEGAGCVSRGEVVNCRIRTAFTTDEGKRIYLEMIGVESTKHSPKDLQKYSSIGYVQHCHYITDGKNDENDNSLCKSNTITMEYTNENILAFVNSLGCSFDKIIVLPGLAGYRVFKEVSTRGINYGDEFHYDLELTARREKVYQFFYELERNEGKKYPNFSMWADDVGVLHLLRHFEGVNRHWEIILTGETWVATETRLGRMGC